MFLDRPQTTRVDFLSYRLVPQSRIPALDVYTLCMGCWAAVAVSCRPTRVTDSREIYWIIAFIQRKARDKNTRKIWETLRASPVDWLYGRRHTLQRARQSTHETEMLLVFLQRDIIEPVELTTFTRHQQRLAGDLQISAENLLFRLAFDCSVHVWLNGAL